MQKILILLGFIVSLASGCSVHKLEIQQGNALSLDKIERLQAGMDKRQVRFLMGGPLLQDPFHQDRWDYYYSLRVDEEIRTRHRLTLYFEEEKLARIEKTGPIPADETSALKARRELVSP